MPALELSGVASQATKTASAAAQTHATRVDLEIVIPGTAATLQLNAGLDIAQLRVGDAYPKGPKGEIKMFHCERCGSRYSAMHAATIENCPRCLARDRAAAPLTFKAFRLPNPIEAEQGTMPDSTEGAQREDRAISL